MDERLTDRGGPDGDRGELVVDVRFSNNGIGIRVDGDMVDAVDQAAFVGDGEQNQAVRSLVPVPDLFRVFLGELESSMCCLGRLEARGEISTGDDVELVVCGNSVALDVVHGANAMRIGRVPSSIHS
jgi:hypothetical protein